MTNAIEKLNAERTHAQAIELVLSVNNLRAMIRAIESGRTNVDASACGIFALDLAEGMAHYNGYFRPVGVQAFDHVGAI